MREETFTQDCLRTVARLFSLRCLFFFPRTMPLWSKQAPMRALQIFHREISWVKKAEEEGRNQSRFVPDSVTSFPTIRRVSERDIQMWGFFFHRALSQDSNGSAILMVSFKAAAFLCNKLKRGPRLSNSDCLHRLRRSHKKREREREKERIFQSKSIHRWMCLCRTKWEVGWKVLSYTWMATCLHGLSLFHMWFHLFPSRRSLMNATLNESDSRVLTPVPRHAD